MSGVGVDSGLATAFRRFERAAVDLEQRHARLQDDVTRLEGRLHDSNLHLTTVLDAIDHGVGVVDRDGRLLRSNRALRRMAPVDDDGRPCPEALSRLVIDDETAGSTACLTLDTSDGRRELAVTLRPTGDEAGTRVLTLHDITEIRREDEEGGRRRRLEALGRMAAELAHEVRNPLGSIRLWACLLRDDVAGEQRSMIEHVLAAVAGLESTVSNLLSFAAPPHGREAEHDLAASAADACALVAPTCAVRGVTIRGPEATGCTVRGDAEALRQVVLNLVGNALAATGPGGAINVDVRAEPPGSVSLTVRDDGCGIDADDLPRVFDPFFSRTEGGTGLGLSIVHRTVERHGGRIAVDSLPGRGTTVAVVLPREGRPEE